MAESCIETPEAPAWLSKLESRREKLSQARLGHDSGAGATCNSCGPECPGLDLHFWRKVCRACHCSKDVHDVQDDDISGWAQFQLLGTQRPKHSAFPLIKIKGVTDKPVKLDWIPPNVSTDLVSDYMSCLGTRLAPVAGSVAAKRRRAQLRTQLPAHDVAVDVLREGKTEQEQSEHQEYISRIKEHVVGQGCVVRVGGVQAAAVLNVERATLAPAPKPANKSYALPIKISNISHGIKFNIIPKNVSDKKLVLDYMGNIINSAANLPDCKTSPILGRLVKDKLHTMRIESDRIKSAVEHGPIYDKLFKNLSELNVPMDNDVYLKPIKLFRDEYNRNPQFRDEVTKFANISLGAQIIQNPWNNVNNNPRGVEISALKGTIFAPNGEVWGWKQDMTPEYKAKVLSNTSAQFTANLENVNMTEPQNAAYLRRHRDTDDPTNVIPPLPNYNTHPGFSNLEDHTTEENMTLAGFGTNANLPRNAGSNKQLLQHAACESDVEPLNDSVDDWHLNDDDDEFEARLFNEGVPCQRCLEPMFAGQVAVKADRAGSKAVWHPQCFTCSKCSELLADLVYFFFNGEIYCARDLADIMEIPRCAGCDELIFTRPYTAAEGRAFHVEHFSCYHCDAPLGGNKYVPDDKTGLPICLDCYDKFHAEKCQSCQVIIGPSQQGVSWQSLHWHATCFICSGRACSKSLLSGRFVVKKDMPFCSVPCVQSVIQ